MGRPFSFVQDSMSKGPVAEKAFARMRGRIGISLQDRPESLHDAVGSTDCILGSYRIATAPPMRIPAGPGV